MEQAILDYLEGYFGDELNESTDDDIMNAFTELLETASAVRDFIGEAKKPKPLEKDSAKRDLLQRHHDKMAEARKKRDLHQGPEAAKKQKNINSDPPDPEALIKLFQKYRK